MSLQQKAATGAAAIILIFICTTILTMPRQQATQAAVKNADAAIAVAEERMKDSGYAGELAKDLWPHLDEILDLLTSQRTLQEIRLSKAQWYEAKAAAYEERDNRWIIAFPSRGGGDSGAQITVFKDGRTIILHEPAIRISLFKYRINRDRKGKAIHNNENSKESLLDSD